ncbi:MAG: class I SAM-dependent methyltransferase [Planctomycetota bacterium]
MPHDAPKPAEPIGLPVGLAAAAEDLGVRPADVLALGSGAAPGHRWLALRPDQVLVGGTFRGLDAELGPESYLFLFVPALGGTSAPDDRQLAHWRDAVWPLVHLSAVYSSAGGRTVRRTADGRRKPLEGEPLRAAAVLAGRRRTYAMSPAATVEKFDANAQGWSGAPSSAGYPHFRWMRRLVGRFVPATPGSRVLDFGSGAGWVGIEAALGSRDVQLRAFDPSPELVRIATDNARASGVKDFEARTGFGEDPPYPAEGEAPFDLTISSGVVSFAPDLEAWLDGLARTVRPGGDLVIGDIHPHSFGFKRRRNKKPLLPVRELNAHSRELVRAGLEQRGFRHVRSGAYQLTWPVPEIMHLNESKLGGVLTYPLLWANQAASRIDRTFGSPLQDRFDSWVMHLSRPNAE